MNNLAQKVEELIEESAAKRTAGDYSAFNNVSEAYRLAAEGNNNELKIKAIKERLRYPVNLMRDYTEAESMSRELLELVDTNEHRHEAAVAYNVLGICQDVKGAYIDSRNSYLNCIRLLEDYPEITRPASLTLANAYYNLTKLYTQIEGSHERYEYLEKAEKVFDQIEDYNGLARVWNLKATLLPEDAPIQERRAIFEKAHYYFAEGGESLGRHICSVNLGLCDCHLGKFDDGLPRMHEGLQHLQQTQNLPIIGFTLFQIAEAYRMKGDNEKSLEHLEKAEKVLLSAGANVYLNVVYKEWATNLAAVGRHEEAYEKLLKFIDHVSDRIQFDRQSAVEEARLKYELEKKEKEGEVLRKKNEEIERFNQRLQQSNAELNQFAYVASHDLKEPLRMVSNYMQLLEKTFDGKLTDDQAAYMKYASDGAKRMYSLIDSLLVFSRATVDTALQEVDLNDVLDEVKRTVTSSSTREVDIYSDQLPVLLADYHQMVQLFQNLVANAVKYNDKEQVKVQVSYRLQDGQHRLAVADNGIGIEPKYYDKVFELFKRLHHRESYSGTGIGLSICKKIVHQMNGRIWIEKSDLGGAAFVFTIPAVAV